MKCKNCEGSGIRKISLASVDGNERIIFGELEKIMPSKDGIQIIKCSNCNGTGEEPKQCCDKCGGTGLL